MVEDLFYLRYASFLYFISPYFILELFIKNECDVFHREFVQLLLLAKTVNIKYAVVVNVNLCCVSQKD